MENIDNKDEIDLLDLFNKLWEGRKTIIKSVVVCFIIGLVVAILSPKVYTAKTTLALQSSSNSMGNLGGVASLVGINLATPSANNGISPVLYPKVTNSTPFLKTLIYSKLKLPENNKEVTYFQYYKDGYAKVDKLAALKKYTIGLPGVILGLFKGKEDDAKNTQDGQGNGLVAINKDEEAMFKAILDQLDVNLNDKDGFVEISFSMDDPNLAAQMANTAQEELQRIIIDFKAKKAKEKLDFIEKRFEEAEKDYKSKQVRLASFGDTNRGLISLLPQMRQDQLQAEYTTAFGVYSELAKQLEAQKIQVKEETPVFVVLDPVVVPLEKSKPRRGTIIAVWCLIGMVIGVGIIFGRDFINQIKERDSNKENQDLIV